MRPLLLASLLLAAACQPAGPGVAEAGARGEAAEGVAAGAVLALLPPDAAGATAAASGVLALDGRCLVLDNRGSRTRLAFATPATTWDGAAGALRVGGRSFRLGTRVAVGGALFTGAADRLAWVAPPVAECAGPFWIVSSIEPG